MTVMARESGASSNPGRQLSAQWSSRVLDRPVKPGDDGSELPVPCGPITPPRGGDHRWRASPSRPTAFSAFRL